MKSLFNSRTFWLAVAQAVVGIVVVALTELDLVGYAAMAKAMLDALLRLDTTTPVSLKPQPSE